ELLKAESMDMTAFRYVSRAVKCESEGDEQGAISNYEKAAQVGCGAAARTLAEIYDRRTKKIEAFIWYLKGAELGDSEALLNTALRLVDGEGVAQKKSAALAWFEKCGNNGVIPAQSRAGIMYMDGDGIPKDANRALMWFRKAAHLGDANSQYMLGRI